jgi:hypothetical protein
VRDGRRLDQLTVKRIIPKALALQLRLLFAWTPEKRTHVRRSVGGLYRKSNGRKPLDRAEQAHQVEIRG